MNFHTTVDSSFRINSCQNLKAIWRCPSAGEWLTQYGTCTQRDRNSTPRRHGRSLNVCYKVKETSLDMPYINWFQRRGDYNLDLERSPKTHRGKAWQPAEKLNTGDEVQWEAFRSLETGSGEDRRNPVSSVVLPSYKISRFSFHKFPAMMYGLATSPRTRRPARVRWVSMNSFFCKLIVSGICSGN